MPNLETFIHPKTKQVTTLDVAWKTMLYRIRFIREEIVDGELEIVTDEESVYGTSPLSAINGLRAELTALNVVWYETSSEIIEEVEA